MKIVDSIDITLYESSVSQALYDTFTMAGSWDSDEYVYVINESDDTTPRYPVEIYQSLEDANTGNYPPTSLTKWALVSSSNRWKMFDDYISEQTEDTKNIKIEINCSQTNAVGLFNLQGSEVTLIQATNTDLVTDGDCSSDSFTKGDGWAYDGGDDDYNCDGTQVADSKLYQDCSTVAGKEYFVKFTVSNYSAGNIAPMAGGTAGTDVAADGEHFEIITAGGVAEDGLIADADFIGTVDDISIMSVISHNTVELGALVVADYYEYFFGTIIYVEDLFWEYPYYANSRLIIEIATQSGTAACGIVSLGKTYKLGRTSYDPKIGIEDYSKKETDTLGRTYLSQGAYAKTLDIDMWLYNYEIDYVYRRFAAIRGRAAIFNANNEGTSYETMIVYGFYEDFKIVIPGPTISKCSIEIQGLI